MTTLEGSDDTNGMVMQRVKGPCQRVTFRCNTFFASELGLGSDAPL